MTRYFASCSFGKDSIATVLLALIHKEPLDGVVFSEVMFDSKANISGETPEHIDFIRNIAIPKLYEMGCPKIHIVRAKRDYCDIFLHTITKGKHLGQVQGFPIGGMCKLNSELKVKPIRDFYKRFQSERIIQYIGIAIDETSRLETMHKSTDSISLLEKYEYTEAMAFELCKEYGLISPIYETGSRGGCWFCPNAKIRQYVAFRSKYPNVWNRLLELDATPNLISRGFRYGTTIQQVQKQMNDYELNQKLQLKLF